MKRKQKLELTWVGKDERPRLEPRILVEDPALSYHARERVNDRDRFDNMLIQGDNLLALKALEQEFAGKIQCIYIDPPFNTQQAFEHFDDGIEHSLWLGLLRDRLEIVRALLAPEGTLAIHIDDNELGYLTILLDEIFGRNNRLSVVTFKQGAATGHKAINPGCVTTSNFVLLYARDKSRVKLHRVFTGRERDKRYGTYIINRTDHHSKWRYTTLAKAFAASIGLSQREARRLEDYSQALNQFVIEQADSVIRTARPSYDEVGEEARQTIDMSIRAPGVVFHLPRQEHSDMYFRDGERLLFYRQKLKLLDGYWVAGEPLTTIWDDILSNNLHNEGGVEFPKSKKPEGLIKRVLDLTTVPGDIVLDSFAGSGTTGAVAHKMGRRWLLVELGEHAVTHIVPRLQRVVDGIDVSGVSEAVNWKGGGGFRFYRLAPSLLEKDQWGNWVISKEYNPAMLAEAACKLEGFRYAPHTELFWQQGHSTERDFIYVTTQTLNATQLEWLSEQVGPDRSLLILCNAWLGSANAWPNLTLKKIPNAVLGRCEFGRDDYSLQVANLPAAPEPDAAPEPVTAPAAPRRRGRKRPTDPAQESILDTDADA